MPTEAERLAELRHSGRDACVAAAMEAVDDEVSSDAVGVFHLAASAVDGLVDAALLFPAERWDEECHRCEHLIRDHLVDGRCPPDRAEPQLSDPKPGDSS